MLRICSNPIFIDYESGNLSRVLWAVRYEPNLILSPRTFLSFSRMLPVSKVRFLNIEPSSFWSAYVSPTYSTFQTTFLSVHNIWSISCALCYMSHIIWTVSDHFHYVKKWMVFESLKSVWIILFRLNWKKVSQMDSQNVSYWSSRLIHGLTGVHQSSPDLTACSGGQ